MNELIIDTKLVLWRIRATDVVSRETVLEQIPVTITEVRDVPTRYGKRRDRGQGFKAVSETGKEFTCNWENFPDEDLFPTIYWDEKDGDGLSIIMDAFQAFNCDPFAYWTRDRKRATPLGATICKKHRYAYQEGDGCPECD